MAAAAGAHVIRWAIFAGLAVVATALFAKGAGGSQAVAGAILSNGLLITVFGLTMMFFRPSRLPFVARGDADRGGVSP